MALQDVVRCCCAAVRQELGGWFSEATYHRALEAELRLRGIPYESEVTVLVPYKGHTVGTVRVDLVVDGSLLVELKATPRLHPQHDGQARKYLGLLRLETALVANMTGADGVEFSSVTSTSA